MRKSEFTLLTQPITTVEQTEAYLKALITVLGLGFHIDTDFADYVENDDTPKGWHPMFDKPACALLQARLDEACEVCRREGIDEYELALSLMRPAFEATRQDQPKS